MAPGYLRDHDLDQTHHFYIIDSDGKCTLDEAMGTLRELGIAPHASENPLFNYEKPSGPDVRRETDPLLSRTGRAPNSG